VGSEFELIAALRERAEGAGAPSATARLLLGSGDDAAVTAPAGAEAVSVDAVVEGVHFDRAVASPQAIGHKALATALSDLAAMGAKPGEAYVQLGIPGDLSERDCLELADGMAAVAVEHGVAIAGGDVTSSPALFLALTVVGHADSPDELVRRSGATPGDVLVVTGTLGGAGAGLIGLERAQSLEGLEPAVAEKLRLRQLEPQPRLAAGWALAAAGASAMIDLSDGLGADAGHVAAASGARLRIELDRLPVAEGVTEVAAAAGLDPLDLATGRGEDYELLAAVPPDRLDAARRAVEATGVTLTEIGAVAEGSGVVLSGPRGEERPATGYDQLAPPRSPDDPA
jgi:thiamine-monophosphate kinase